MHGDMASLQCRTTVYFESQTDRVLICVEFTAVIVLKYRGMLSLVCRVGDDYRYDGKVG